MTQNNLYLTVGPSGSGKSTTIRKYADANPNSVIISRDTIRFSLLGENDSYFSKEKEVFKLFIEKIQKALDAGKDVYADATHLNYASRHKLLSNLHIGNETKISVLYFQTPLEECLKRNKNRSGFAYVPEEVIKKQFQSVKFPQYEEMVRLKYFSISSIFPEKEDKINGQNFCNK